MQMISTRIQFPVHTISHFSRGEKLLQFGREIPVASLGWPCCSLAIPSTQSTVKAEGETSSTLSATAAKIVGLLQPTESDLLRKKKERKKEWSPSYNTRLSSFSSHFCLLRKSQFSPTALSTLLGLSKLALASIPYKAFLDSLPKRIESTRECAKKLTFFRGRNVACSLCMLV